MPSSKNRKRVSLSDEREKFLVERIKHIIEKYPLEKDRRHVFSQTCGTVAERITILDKHDFEIDEKIILNWT